MEIDTTTPKRPTIRTYTDTARDYVRAEQGNAIAAHLLSPAESNAPHRPTPQTIAANHALRVRQACHTLRPFASPDSRNSRAEIAAAIAELLDALGELETPAEQIARQSAATTN